ncbi:MAG: UDP-N-acetylmuramoyl-tripeptide--D-alanyl-D-alanine ligase [Desulfitobacteriaceae bacterium]|nr:UDP-N-acetylmuramoyl-tripeptide--D-alanyl-D-alanine ligase [Desulfitobacteriaceae bacterium]
MVFNPKAEKPIIAVTGSAGKTMVKTMVSAILRERWVVFESKDYYNTVDKTLIHANEIDFIHRAAILEYGMAFPGAITEHCRIIQPNIGVITNVGLAHIGNFEGKVELLAAAKSELITEMNPSGILFINADDSKSELLHTRNFMGKILTVGIKVKADYTAENINYSEKGMTFTLILNGNEYPFLIPIFGEHNVYNALFAIGIADQLGFLPAEMETGLQTMKKPNHRLVIHRLKDGITVIDDTVHSHPPAVKTAINVLLNLAKQKKMAILGSMPELGVRTYQDYEDIGHHVADMKLDFLYTFGKSSVHIGEEAIKAGYPANQVKHYKQSYLKVMHRELVQTIEPGLTILVKGASRLNMYETVKFLCDHYKPD